MHDEDQFYLSELILFWPCNLRIKHVTFTGSRIQKQSRHDLTIQALIGRNA
jgi:hypothetical protein